MQFRKTYRALPAMIIRRRTGVGRRCMDISGARPRTSGHHPQATQGFAVQPRRYIIERSFAWLIKCRRSVKDYERLLTTPPSLIRLGLSQRMLVSFRRSSANACQQKCQQTSWREHVPGSRRVGLITRAGRGIILSIQAVFRPNPTSGAIPQVPVAFAFTLRRTPAGAFTVSGRRSPPCQLRPQSRSPYATTQR